MNRPLFMQSHGMAVVAFRGTAFCIVYRERASDIAVDLLGEFYNIFKLSENNKKYTQIKQKYQY